MKVKTSELSGVQLDWAVAKCEGLLAKITQAQNKYELCIERKGVVFTHGPVYSPSTDWSQGGPVIEREKIGTLPIIHGFHDPIWVAVIGGESSFYGSTPLIAAMRCYVASKLGDEVEIPEELV